MTKKEYFLLYLISTVFFSILTLVVRDPGYMDAEYYYAGGVQIVTGNGGSEPYIWNYLNQPQTVPADSFSYWMPFSSLLAAGGMFLLGSTGFYAARLLFVLLAGTIPLLASWFAVRYFPSRGSGWLAGCSALFGVYYLPYLTITDSFTPIMVLGGLFVLFAYKIWQARDSETVKWWWFLVMGLAAGLIHLTRADGSLWVPIGICVITCVWWKAMRRSPVLKRLVIPIIVFLAGYLAIMSGWFFRNLSVYQSFMPPGNGQLLWATSYNDIFFYSTGAITPSRFFDTGGSEIINSRLSALWANFKSLLGVNGGIILVPLIAMGMWATRKHFITRLTFWIALVNLLVMSLVFPYAGYRGGFFHSNSAVQVILWGLVPVGLNGFIDLGVKYRKWIPGRAWKMFGAAVIGTLTILSSVIFMQKVVNPSPENISWNATLEQFSAIDDEIVKITGDEDSVVMVNDPPGYFLATQRTAIVNPSDGVEELLAAAKKYDARFVVIDENNVLLLNELNSGAYQPEQMKLIGKYNESEIYEILE